MSGTQPKHAAEAAAKAPLPIVAAALIWPALAAPWLRVWHQPAHRAVCAMGPQAAAWLGRRREASEAVAELTRRLSQNGLRHPVDSLAALTEAAVQGANLATRDAQAALDLWAICAGTLVAPSDAQDHDRAETPARAAPPRALRRGQGHAFPV